MVLTANLAIYVVGSGELRDVISTKLAIAKLDLRLSIFGKSISKVPKSVYGK